MLSNQVELLSKKTDGLCGPSQVHPAMQCNMKGGMSNIEYPPYNPSTENKQVHYMGNNSKPQNNPNSNTYNPGWRNHPNFSWGSLPSNTETNPKEQLQAITARDSEGVDEPKVSQKNMVEEGKVEIPDSKKFLKELLTDKRKLDEELHLELNAVCSAILQNKLPCKLKDPRSFTVPCIISSLSIDNALADLGESIIAMPYKMFK
ncbi:T-complex protein 1 subunit delta-like [Gossypium australe]|uniref:T-complex protein 1 subunit delta-like n=1 Tax=Gossypium australe TaxID=47621 RepID=A0A5B6WFU4_9ROSI|nr:T-complex protein 1 subunit delta-like [Gossypium australe]